jgi:hypothetical protein
MEASDGMGSEAIDHDALFKELLTTFFAEFLELFFPEMHAYIEPDSITFLDRELFADSVEGRMLEPDLVAKVRLRNPERSEAYCLIHLEAQSTPEAAFARRMHKYFSRLFDKHDLPVYPIAIFSYDTPRREEPDTFTISFPGLEVLRFHFQVIQLNRLNWRDFVNKPNPVASALMAKMNIAPQDRRLVKFECLRLMATLKLDRPRMRIIAGFVENYLRLTWEENRQIVRQLGGPDINADQETQETIMRLMELPTTWHMVGREEGRAEATESLLLLQLSRRFGSLAEETEAAIRDLTAEVQKELALDLLDFKTLDDLVQWLAAHK